MTDAWEKTGRDAADEDIAGGAEPCTTLDEARRRIGQWLRSQTPAVAAADAEACAAAYLRAWEAHARDTSPRAGLDLDAITKRARRVYPKRGWDGGEAERALPVVTEDVPALVAEVIRLRTLRDDIADAFDGLVMKVWRAAGETHEPPADVAALLARVAAARREGAEAMREAFGRALAAETERLRRSGSAAEPLADAVDEVVADARRALARSGGES